jgi:copper chaperone CopZ
MFRNKKLLFILVVSVGLALAAWGWSQRGLSRAEASMAVFNVGNLTCGSCVSNVQRALKGLDGVGAVEVSVTAGRSQVEYDRQRTDAETIARTITAAGYPATIRETLSVADYQALQAEEGRLASRYVARIGKRLLPRAEFSATLKQRQTGLSQPLAPQELQQLRLQVWNDLLQRELLLAAAESSQVVVQDGEVALEIEKLKGGHAGFEELIQQRFGGIESFTRQIKNDLIIRKHLNENVAGADLAPGQRQELLENWYQQLVKTTPVVIFDPALKASGSGSGSGCGGSCCG